jgi:hypothetical protein
VSGFAEQAQRILDAAVAAAERGQPCSETTILIGAGGGIRMIADSDWPLDSLIRDGEVRAAYRVTARGDALRVEGREGRRKCLVEATLVTPRKRAAFALQPSIAGYRG